MRFSNMLIQIRIFLTKFHSLGFQTKRSKLSTQESCTSPRYINIYMYMFTAFTIKQASKP